jgi:hypothetical protein
MRMRPGASPSPSRSPAMTVVLVAHRPARFAVTERHGNRCGGTGNAQQRATLGVVDGRDTHGFGICGCACDQPSGGEIEHGMHGVTDTHVESAGLANHDDRRAAQRARRANDGQHNACRNHDHREDDTGDQRKRLRAKRVVEHPTITTHQRVRAPAQQKTISADIGSRCRLPCHTSPASQPNASRKRPLPRFSATSPAAAPLDRGRGASQTSTHADRRCAQTSCSPTCSIRPRTFRPAADTDHAPPRRRARPGP